MSTPTNLIDGRAIAEEIHKDTTRRIERLKDAGIEPGLAFIRVGEDPASQVYVGMKERMAARLGVTSQTQVLPESTRQDDLLARIAELNLDPRVHGILVQAPLPAHIDAQQVYATVAPNKDVDGFNPVNVGKLLLGDSDGFIPCTPAGILELLIRAEVTISGAEVVVLGRGNIVGKPMAALLMQKAKHANATVTVCHSRTRDIAGHCRRADILIAAMGVPKFVRAPMVKPGSVIVDVGVNRITDPAAKRGYRLVGDVDFARVQPIARLITPNPGGVGPMTIALLLRNTVRAAEAASARGPSDSRRSS